MAKLVPYKIANAKLASLPIKEGQLIVTTDTKCMYLDVSNTSRIRLDESLYTKLATIAEGATKVEASETNGNIKINGVDTTIYTPGAVENTTYTLTKSGNDIILTGSDGSTTKVTDSNTTYSNATTTTAGLMSKDDKTKLDGIDTGAQKNTITGVKGDNESSYRTGNVNITKVNIGLGNVENKSSATIRGELTKANVTSALGYTPPESDTNTTYTLTQDANDGHKITLTPSSGTATTITIPDNNTNTTYTFATGDSNGQIKVTPSGGSAQNVAVKGLAGAAYKAVDTSIAAGSSSANVPTSAAVASFVEGKGYKTTDNNTTYTLTQDATDGHKITLTPSSGTAQTITIPDNNTTYNAATQSAAGLMSAADKKKLDGIAEGAQKNTNTTYTLGKSGSTITLTGSDGSTTSVTDSNTTYSAMTGASADADGAQGLVPKPTKGNQAKYLRADGTWQTPTNTNTTYTLTQDATDGHKITLTPSSGNATTITIPDNNTTYTGSNGVTVSGTTISNSGVRSVATGDNNGTIKVNTNGTSTNVAVKGLGSLAYKSSLSASDVGAIASAAKGAANGVAELDADGKVPSTQLPSYVDDVLEYDKQASFPTTGETGKIYIAQDTNKTYRWSGSAYVEISASLALGETSSTAYRGDRGKTAYDHANAKGSAFASGLYKITTNAQGHVTAATAVTKADITGLGIPGSDTNTWTAFKGATADAAGTAGYVPAPAKGDQAKFFRADGTWVVPTNTNTTYTFATGDANGQIKVTPSGGSASNISVKGLADAAYKAVVTSIDTSASLPTSNAVKTFVEGKGYKTTDTNTTYTLTQDATDGHKLTFTPSSGNATTITIPDNNTTYSAATTSAQGLMSANDKTKLDYTNVAYATCSTAAATAEKAITLSGNTKWALQAGSIICIKFSATNTAQNPKFNVNSTGAKSVWYNTAVITTSSLAYAGQANRPQFYMYDGTQYVFLGWSLEANDNTVPSAYCSTAAATAAKTASCSGYALLNNSYIQVIVTATNTSQTALTLNINGKGAKPIYINGAASSTSNYTLPAGSYLVFYNGTNYYFRTDGKITGSITGDAATVNGKTVAVNVPSDAKFTDTTYSSKAAASGGTDVSLVTTGEKYTWNNKSSLAIGTTSTTAAAGNHTHTASLATDTGTSAITLAHGGKYKLTAGGSSVIFTMPTDNNTTYSSKAAASGGTDVSLVTTGEKYTWNNKSSLAIGTTATTAAAGNHTHTTSLAADTGTSSITLAAGSKYKLTAGGTSVIFTMPSDSNTDTKVTVSNTNPTSGTWYYPTSYTATSGTGGVIANDGLRHYSLQGTASAAGRTILQLGNATATGTAGNKYGEIRIYAEKAGFATVKATAAATAETVHILPNTGGTILNTGTTSFTQSLTSGTVVGTIKINGTETTLYAPTNSDTKNTAGTTNTTSKIFLAGATSQAANPQTYSNVNCYASGGKLYSNAKQVVNLSDSQALTNKTYNGYTLAAACAKAVDTSFSLGTTSTNLPTSAAVNSMWTTASYSGNDWT